LFTFRSIIIYNGLALKEVGDFEAQNSLLALH